MTWIWMGLGGLALLIAAVMLIGMLLPEEYESRVEMSVAQSPDVVWAALNDPRQVSYAGRQARSIEVLREGEALEWREDMGPSVLTMSFVEFEPLKRIVCEATDSVVPMTMRRVFELEEREGRTFVTCSQKTTIKSGTYHVPIFRVTMALGAAKAGMKDYLKRCAGAIGEEARFE